MSGTQAPAGTGRLARLHRLFSRKLLVLVFASVALMLEKLPPEAWVWTAALYLGANAASKFARRGGSGA